MANRSTGVRELARVAGNIVADTLPGMDFSVAVPRRDYARRWRRVQTAMKAKGYTLGFACGSELDRSDGAWLSGVFDPIIERYAVLLPVDDRPVILAGSEGGHVIEEAAEASGSRVCLLREFQISDEDYRHAHFQSLGDVAKVVGRNRRKHKVAVFSSKEFLPQAQYELLVQQFGRDNVVLDPLPLQRIKYEKSLAELKICEQANTVADAALRGVLAAIRPGVTELQVAGVAEFIMKALNAGRFGFPTIVTSGERNYTVIGPATPRVIQRGDMVSVGVSPTWHGYHGIVRRTVRCGAKPTRAQNELIAATEGLYRVVMDAIVNAGRKGLPANTVDRAGKAYLAGLRLTNLHGDLVEPKEPYTFVHNTGCSECQEGYGAITPWADEPMARNVALMIDVALLGFERRGEPIFPTLYAVVEDAFWKKGRQVGVYNRFPLNVQQYVGNAAPIRARDTNPYYRPVP